MARILIIEDEPILGLELSEDLESFGHEVLGVEPDGDMGMYQAVKHKPDLILMDIRLGGFRDGIESAAQMRGFIDTPIIYLTSYPLAEVSERISRTKLAWFVQKPYETEAMLGTIRGVLDGTLPPIS